jgi:hypothetical protein
VKISQQFRFFQQPLETGGARPWRGQARRHGAPAPLSLRTVFRTAAQVSVGALLLQGQRSAGALAAPAPTRDLGMPGLPGANDLAPTLPRDARLEVRALPRNCQDVLTQHNDDWRTGMQRCETALSVDTVNARRFGKKGTFKMAGQAMAQPLYVHGLDFGGGKVHNALIVVTMHNDVYAFDADHPSAAPLYHTTMGLPVAEFVDDAREIGILSTPVIDRTTNTLYVVGASTANGKRVYVLHGLDVRTGVGKIKPVTVEGSVSGNGAGASGGSLHFDPNVQLQRPGLLLQNGQVSVGFASKADEGNYHGWIFSYDKRTLKRTGIYCASPNSRGNGIWQAGGGLAADESGNLFVATGNGFGSDPAIRSERTESIVRLKQTATQLTLADWFTPSNWKELDKVDLDLGSTSVLLPPGTDQAIAGGKDGYLYNVRRSAMGHLVQGDTQLTDKVKPGAGGIFSSPVYWKGPKGGRVFVWPGKDALKAYAFDGKHLSKQPVSQGAARTANWQGAPISVSGENGKAGAIVWAYVRADDGHGIVRAYSAEDLSRELWNSDQNPGRDRSKGFVRFVTPTIADGKVFVPTTDNTVEMYGLL